MGILQNADFSTATLKQVNWKDSQFLRCGFPADFYEEDIHALCPTRQGRRGLYRYINGQDLNLMDMDWREADLLGANLNRANLRGPI